MPHAKGRLGLARTNTKLIGSLDGQSSHFKITPGVFMSLHIVGKLDVQSPLLEQSQGDTQDKNNKNGA